MKTKRNELVLLSLVAIVLMLGGNAFAQGDNTVYFTTYYSKANTAAVPDGTDGDREVSRAGDGPRNGAAIRPGAASGAQETAERVIRLYQRLGLPLATCAGQSVITPACGLAGASPAQARAALTRCREAASMLPELIEETGGE